MYYIKPRPGYSPEDIIVEGPNSRNAWIVKEENGVVIEFHPYSSTNVSRWRAKPHPSIFRREGYFDLGGRYVALEDTMFIGYLADGWCPFKQLICIAVEDRRAMGKDELLAYIIEDKRYLKDKPYNWRWLSRLIDYLREQGWLNAGEIGLVRGNRRMPIGKNRIPVKEGFNPVIDQMYDFIKIKKNVSKGELSDYMILDLGWIDKDPVTGASAEKILDYYIKYLLRKEYIKEIEQNRYEVLKPLEKN